MGRAKPYKQSNDRRRYGHSDGNASAGGLDLISGLQYVLTCYESKYVSTVNAK